MVRLKRMYWILIIFVFMTSCGPSTPEDFLEEGESEIRSLIKELKSIHTRDQLITASVKLQRHFDNLVTIIIAAEENSDAHPEQGKAEFPHNNNELTDLLRIELNRLYRLEGGRQLIEKSQENALNRLDAFEKRRAKLRESKRPF